MSENGLRTGLLMDSRQVASHAALQRSAGRTRSRRDEAWGMTRNRSGAVETHPPKSPPQAALYRWGGNEGGAATRRPRGGRLGDHSGDRPEKRPPSEAGGERGPISQVPGVFALQDGTTDQREIQRHRRRTCHGTG